MIRLLSSNYSEVEYANASAVTLGQFVPRATLGGALNAFAFAAFAAAAIGAYVTKAERAAATKAAGDSLAFAPGEKVYYNVSNARVSKTTTDPLIGYAKRAAAAADTEVIIEFDGSLGSVALNDLSDVVLASVTDGQVLKYEADDTAWINAADAT